MFCLFSEWIIFSFCSFDTIGNIVSSKSFFNCNSISFCFSNFNFWFSNSFFISGFISFSFSFFISFSISLFFSIFISLSLNVSNSFFKDFSFSFSFNFFSLFLFCDSLTLFIIFWLWIIDWLTFSFNSLVLLSEDSLSSVNNLLLSLSVIFLIWDLEIFKLSILYKPPLTISCWLSKISKKYSLGSIIVDSVFESVPT